MIRLDKINGSGHIASFTFATELVNGAVVKLGALATDGESRVGSAVGNVATDSIVLHASVEMQYASDAEEKDFKLKVGKKGRGYYLTKGDIITLTDDEITGTKTVGLFVVPVVAGTKLAVGARATENLVFEIIEKTTLNGVVASVLQVVVA
jgi:hypothetical protein